MNCISNVPIVSRFEGEDHVVDALRESLDGSCHIFRNLHFNGRKEDIDIALVSPWGVFAIEVKNLNIPARKNR